MKDQKKAKRTNKKLLNENAIRFKLESLENTNVRYEVIYKNIVRDLRKYYTKEFCRSTNYNRRKKRHTDTFYEECLT